MSIPYVDLEQLKEAAESATQGEWWIDSHGHTLVAHTSEGTKVVLRTDDSMGPAIRHPETGNLSHWPNDWDASFIVTAQPSTVLALIAQIESLRANLDFFQSAFYAVAKELDIGARPSSPKEVFETEILPGIKAAVVDAGRYRYLRPRHLSTYHDFGDGGCPIMAMMFKVPGSAAACDDAIDAAMGKVQP